VTQRLSRLTSLATLAFLAVTVPRTASAQVGASTDIVVGTVTGPDSQPLAGATVVVTSRETQASRQLTTDARGRFTLLFPDGGGRYDLVVRYIGMAPAHLAVARRGDEDRIVANVQMGLAAVSLEPVSVTARRGGRSDQVGRGASGQGLSGEELARLPTDASDLNTVATLAPGVLAIAGGDTSAANFSVAGQRPTANNVTLDGMSLGSGEVPQDAVRTIRVVTSSYDVARGQFSGGLVQSTTRSGTNTPQGSFTLTLRDRTVAWGDAVSTPFGQGLTQTQLGGGFGGPIIPNRLFVFAAFQGRWRAQALPSLATADAATLDRLGVSPDSASRFRTLASATGTPATLPGSDERAGNNTLALLRLDWQLSPVHTVTLRFDGHWISQEPTHVGSLALPTTGARRSQRSGGVMASLTSYLWGKFTNEARGYVAVDHKDVGALLALPTARVEVASPLAGGGQDVATLSFGGNGAAPQRTDDRTIELADELSWVSNDAKHRLKLGSYLNRTRVDDDQTPNQLGTFTFSSLAALSADSPSTFTRTLAPQDLDGTTWNAALYAGDTWHAAPGLHVMYGIRVETAGFDGAPAANGTVESLFGVRVDRLPRERHVSPRIGFTWGFGSGEGDVRHATYLRGGIGDFRSPAPGFLYSALLGAPGTITAETQLGCVGTDVPTPDWSAYQASPVAIPSRCADSTSGAAATPRPNVTTFDPRFTAPHAWRASLGVMQRIAGYSLTVDASYARGQSQYGFRDLNLVGSPRFALRDEGNRPVYVPADSIVPSTGAASATASRAHPEFGRVLLIRSDLEAETKQLTVALGGGTKRGATVRLSYTLTRSVDQSSFACCSASQGFAAPTTAADPNVPEWAKSDLERRHALLATLNYPLSEALDIGVIGRLVSGAPFTPLVGSDVNGDGVRNDRAFLFDPVTASDTAMANGMRALLTTASAGVRRCLERQMGVVAARNSCTSPWQPSVDLQINWHPAWFGEDRRLTVSLLTVNLLGGIDELVHGAAHRLGWGYATTPDPVLLYVRGFDPGTERFRYAVNGRFGSLESAGGGVIVPFQIALQGHLTLGPSAVGERSRRASGQTPDD
jgi:carboxypeptidase family protein